ncbi:DUF4956 domain-containing protein [Cellulosimicrobium sp. CUA-896]|uniref:DUF4956 domain-containing protein n=1 Tax=Cellulosimicrobium sp. CUA-896 TaxID=1517881 RepID=UPI0009FA406F|nr:DUF4956 domain-containing protein [Cellulosimicrobium sp. CUA-896]
MSQPLLYVVDLVAVAVLALGLYFPRHRRRDLVVAYLGVNVGVLVVAATLASSAVGAGLGLGLFGVLSIIRLRSTELSQTEVAYYFAALALGLLGGLGATTGWLSVAGSALVVAVMAAADHQRVLRRARSRTIVLDRALVDEEALVAHLEQLLGARVHGVSVQRVDLVNDTTWVDVRFSAPGRAARRSGRSGVTARAEGRADAAAPTAPDVAPAPPARAHVGASA